VNNVAVLARRIGIIGVANISGSGGDFADAVNLINREDAEPLDVGQIARAVAGSVNHSAQLNLDMVPTVLEVVFADQSVIAELVLIPVAGRVDLGEQLNVLQSLNIGDVALIVMIVIITGSIVSWATVRTRLKS
jgi:hypothetical protein